MAENQRMSQYQARRQAHLLWMRSNISQSSTVPSFAESLKRSLLTFQKHGIRLLEKLAYTTNTLTLYLAFVKVSSSISLQSPPLKHLPIDNLSPNSPKNSLGLSSTRSPSNATLDQSRTRILRRSSALSNLRPSPSFRNPEKPTNIATSKIILSQYPLPPFSQTHLSIPSLTPTRFPQLGEHSHLSRYSYTAYRPTRNSPPVTSQKPTAPFHYTIPSGPLLWSDWVKTHSPLTHQSVLDPDRPPGLTVKLGTRDAISYVSMESVPYPAGLTTTSSSVSGALPSRNITNSGEPGAQTSRQEANISKVGDCGLGAEFLKTVQRSSSMKTVAFPAKISLSDQPARLRIPYSPTTSTTSISSRTNSGYLGSYQKTCPSLQPPPTLDSIGILKLTKYPWAVKRKRNTSELQKNGCRIRRTLSKRSKNSMVNSYIPAWLSQQDAHTSPSWRLCSGSSMTVLSYHAPAPEAYGLTWTGGSASSDSPPFPDPSLPPFPFTMSGLTRTPVQKSVLPSSSANTGERGASYQAGRHSMDSETSDGLKLSLLNASLGASWTTESKVATSSHMGITKELSKVGRTDAAVTKQSTEFSKDYTPSSQVMQFDIPFTQLMSAANATQQTPPREASTPLNTYSSLPFNSLQNLVDFSLTLNLPIPRRNNASAEKVVTPKPSQRGSMILTNGIETAYNRVLETTNSTLSTSTMSTIPARSKFNQALAIDNAPGRATPRPYQRNLIPRPSALRPHCLARDRLRLWRPSRSRLDKASGSIELSELDLERILNVINVSWAQGTRDTYGAGLLVYHVFCDMRDIPEDERCPASPLLVITFISSCAGSYAGSTLANYVFAVKAWHLLHGATWSMNDAEVKAALTGAATLAPPTSKRPKRKPITINLMERIFSKLDLEDAFDSAVAACFSTTFYSVSRTGEFTVPSLNAFDPSLHVKPSDVSNRVDRNNLEVTVFHLPRTKCAEKGEDVFWSQQDGITDPKINFHNHLRINSPPRDGHLFAYRHNKGYRPLTKRAFLDRINVIAKR